MEIVEEGKFTFTNVEVFKKVISKEVKELLSEMKDANRLFRKKEYRQAQKMFEDALKKSKEIQKGFSDIPEQKWWIFSLGNWAIIDPQINILSLLYHTAMSIYVGTPVIFYFPKSFKDYWDGVFTRFKIRGKNPTWSKHDIMIVYDYYIRWCTDHIEACKKAIQNPASEEYDAIEEAFDNILAEADMIDDAVMLEQNELHDILIGYIKSYT